MKIAAIQLNPVIGDFSANISAILSWTKQAEAAGCELAIFPEMAASGYPPQDLLERPAFVAANEDAVNSIREQARIAVIFGSITPCTSPFGKPLHNSAIFTSPDLSGTVHKQLLPTYDVFDESRYFEPGQTQTPLHFMETTLGITICEDIFNDPILPSNLTETFDGGKTGPATLYQHNPVQTLFEASPTGLDLLINIAASPFHLKKPEAKQAYFAQIAQKYKTPVIYVNQVGAQDSLIFDGQSLVIDDSGAILAKAPRFSEAMIVYDSASGSAVVHEVSQPQHLHIPRIMDSGAITPQTAEAAVVFEALVCGTRDYMRKCGFKKAVIGLSGGIDSALTAAIAAEALGPENVLGVALPSPYTSQESIDDARDVAANLGTAFEIIPIGDIFSCQLAALAPLFKELPINVTEQNIQARIRGNLLMALANKFGSLLLSTGNKSEMAVGYCTLYGDMSGGLSVISDVPKMMVYQISNYLNTQTELIPQRTISKAPTAELAPNQKDQDDLPPYEILDPILEMYLEEKRSIAQIIAQGFQADIVKDVVRRIMINEHKRKQAPMGLKVTSKAFGYGRRYPTTQRFQENQAHAL